VRLNTFCGFADLTRSVLERCARDGGLAVVYGHPHSITSGGPQDETMLVPFLRRVAELRDANHLDVVLPRELVEAA
jgi:hypothetical protein